MADLTEKITSLREYQEAERKGAPFAQLSDHGLSRWGGYIMDEFLVQLQGASGRKLYREMADNDPVIGALLQAIEMAVRAVSWRVQPAGPKRADAQVAEFVSGCLFEDMSFSWEDTLSDILTCLIYGWSYSETVFKRRGGDVRDPTQRSRFDDGKIGLRKLVTIAQDTLDHWEMQEDGGVDGLWQRPPDGTVLRYIPLDKALLFRTTTKRNNPEGRAVIRNAYMSWYYRKEVMTILGIGLERDLTGLPLIQAPEGVNVFAPEYAVLLQTLKKIVRDLRVDEQGGVILPFGFDFKLMASPGSRQHNVVEVLNYLDRRIAMTCLAQFLMLGMEQVGSFALSQSQSDLFILSLAGWVDGIRQVFNHYLIPRLLKLNGIAAETPPTLERGEIGSPNLTELAEYVNKLAGAAVLNPDEDMEQYLRQVAHLPEIGETEEKPEETAPRQTLARQRLMGRRDLLGDEQTLRELGYSEELVRRIAEEKRMGRLASSNIGEQLLAAFERGHLSGDQDRDA